MVWVKVQDSTTVRDRERDVEPVVRVGAVERGKLGEDRAEARDGRGDGQDQDREGAFVLAAALLLIAATVEQRAITTAAATR